MCCKPFTKTRNHFSTSQFVCFSTTTICNSCASAVTSRSRGTWTVEASGWSESTQTTKHYSCCWTTRTRALCASRRSSMTKSLNYSVNKTKRKTQKWSSWTPAALISYRGLLASKSSPNRRAASSSRKKTWSSSCARSASSICGAVSSSCRTTSGSSLNKWGVKNWQALYHTETKKK